MCARHRTCSRDGPHLFCSAALGRGHDHLHHVEAKSSNLFKATEHIQFGARNENWVCLTPNSVVSCYTKLCQVIIPTMIIINVLTLSSPWGNLAVFLKPGFRRSAFLRSGLLLVPGSALMPVMSGLGAGLPLLDHPFPFPAHLEFRVSFLYPYPSSSSQECPFVLPRWGLHSVLFKGKSWSREWSFHSLIPLLEISAPLGGLS